MPDISAKEFKLLKEAIKSDLSKWRNGIANRTAMEISDLLSKLSANPSKIKVPNIWKELFEILNMSEIVNRFVENNKLESRANESDVWNKKTISFWRKEGGNEKFNLAV